MSAIYKSRQEMADRVATFDWGSTALGPSHLWPESLRTAVSICLTSRFPMVIYWGHELLTLYNDAYAAILAGKHPWALGREAREVWSEVWPIIAPMMANVMATGVASWSDDLRLVLERRGHPETCYFSFSFSPVRTEDGRIGGIFAAFMETTTKVLRLERDQTRFRMILDAMTDQFFALDSRYRFTFFNRHAEDQMRRLGKDPAALIGKVLWDEFSDVPNADNIRRVMDDRVAVHDELQYGPLNEWVENHMYPSPDGGIVTFQRYITQRKRADEELRHAQDALVHANRVITMGELVASIAHELNQPLSAIVAHGNAALHWLDHAPPDIAETRRATIRIVRDGARAGEILRRIRTWVTRTERTRVPIPIHEVVIEVVSLLQHDALARGVAVRLHAGADLPPVMGDRLQLQQVIVNLMLNAFEMMSARAGSARVLDIETSRAADDMVGVKVRDSGPGFDPADAERIFEAFYTTKPGGMGMGLAICRSIVEAHGGRLWATTIPGTGATFQFVLPTEASGAAAKA